VWLATTRRKRDPGGWARTLVVVIAAIGLAGLGLGYCSDQFGFDASEEGRGLRSEVEPDVRLAHEGGELAVHDADEGLAGREAADHFLAQRLGAHGFDEVLHDRKRDVRFQERDAHLAQGFLDVGFGKARFAAHALRDLREARSEVV